MIELSAEARKAYEVMIANLDTSSQEQLEEQLEVETSEEPSGTEEPDYSMSSLVFLNKCYAPQYFCLR